MRSRTLRQFCTDKFIKDHVYEGDDDGPGGKKRANIKAHSREVGVSTMLYIDGEYMKLLWGEVLGRNRDGTFAAGAEGLFETVDSYMYYESQERKSAKVRGPAKFRYGVQLDPVDKRYKVHHFDGLI